MPTLPDDIQAFLREPNPAVMATLTPSGKPLSVATWYLWEDGKVLVNLDDTRKRLAHMRQDPRISVTVLAPDWYRHVSLHGTIVSITPDEDLSDIDRISQHYRGAPYPNRTSPRSSAWMEVESFHAWPA